MWSKLPDGKVMWQDAGVTEVYDEAGLRRCMRGYLTDESRARFGGENFSTEECFLKGLAHLTKGLTVLLADAIEPEPTVKAQQPPDTTPVWPAYVLAFGITAIIMFGQFWWQSHQNPEPPQKPHHIDKKSQTKQE